VRKAIGKPLTPPAPGAAARPGLNPVFDAIKGVLDE
jgi:hypothetical protein